MRVVLLSLDEALDVHPAGGERHSRRQTVQDGTVFDPDMHVVCVVAADSRHDSDDVDVVDAVVLCEPHEQQDRSADEHASHQ
ncbi:hypothetical protein [Thermocrispum sp.]|uniref:hypothetical protein n=1 Tax=Thermocrispum sp. TaxID=2060768 RepID=UPI00257C888B|nr:hypothetical protein [Thermocrispum sp.]